MICAGCLQEYPDHLMNQIQDDDYFCPVCVFVAAMYKENGIDKSFERGGLALDRLNAKYRKIVKEEYAKSPRVAMRKYCHSFWEHLCFHEGFVDVSNSEFENIKTKKSVFLDPPYDPFQPEKGKEVTFVAENGNVKTRKVFFAKKVNRKSTTHKSKYNKVWLVLFDLNENERIANV